MKKRIYAKNVLPHLSLSLSLGSIAADSVSSHLLVAVDSSSNFGTNMSIDAAVLCPFADEMAAADKVLAACINKTCLK